MLLRGSERRAACTGRFAYAGFGGIVGLALGLVFGLRKNVRVRGALGVAFRASIRGLVCHCSDCLRLFCFVLAVYEFRSW